MNATRLRLISVLFCVGGALASRCMATDHLPASSLEEVELVDFVMTYKPMDNCTQQRLFARIRFDNTTMHPIDFPSFELGGRTVLRLGTQANVEVLAPGDHEWRLMPGAGGQAPDSNWTIPSKVARDVYVDWPVELFVNYPAETVFRITLIDSTLQPHQSQSFRLHEGKYLLKTEYSAKEFRK